ncbi:hypothetical protein P4S70_05005 [Enterovibrio sp. Hal110]
MITLNEVKSRCARENSTTNDQLHFFASKFHFFFSWIFLNLGLSANGVTLVFFITGLFSSLFYSFGGMYVLIGYMLWRLHIIFDLCDGDVARYNQTFSINGAYWDYMIHAVLYPLVFIGISIASYNKFDDVTFLFIGLFGSLAASLTLAVKNNYYRAMLFDGQKLDKAKGKLKVGSGVSFQIKRVIHSILSFEGFLFVQSAMLIFDEKGDLSLICIVFYILVMLMITAVKLYSFSKQGFYSKRS